MIFRPLADRAFREIPDLFDLFICQNRVLVMFTKETGAMTQTVLLVLARCSVSQIGRFDVERVTILVQNLTPFGPRSNKCLGYHAVY